MNWKSLGGSHLSNTYRIAKDTRGYSVWIFGKAQSGCLGREITTLDQAKSVCEKHRSDGRKKETA